MRVEQFSKASKPMEVTKDGMVIEPREVQLRKASLPIEVMEEGRVIEVREKQPEKTLLLMEVILSIDKSAWPLLATELIEVSEEHQEKAFLPIEVTEEGIVIDVMPELEKAPSAIVLVDESIIVLLQPSIKFDIPPLFEP